MSDTSGYMTVAQLAPLLRRTVGGVRAKIDRGELAAERAGKTYLIRRTEALRVFQEMYPGWPVPMALAEESE